MLRDNAELRRVLDERFRYIMVDEYQDTNLAQYAIVRALSVDHPNLSVTGDPDQSIYGWRGATIRNILEFERDFPHVQVVRLEENFRSTKIDSAGGGPVDCEQREPQREDALHGQSGRQTGADGRLSDGPAGSGRDRGSYCQRSIGRPAALPKTTLSSIAPTRCRERSNEPCGRWRLPYQIVRGLEFYQRKEIKDILAYLQLLNNPANDIAFLSDHQHAATQDRQDHGSSSD